MKRILSLGLLIFAAQTFAADSGRIMDADQLNQVLRQSHAGWVAKDNSLNQAGIKAAQMHMGAKRTLGQGVRFHSLKSSVLSNRNLPAVVDWRDNGGNWVTPVLDQGNCGSCVVFATLATLETQYRISSGLSLFNIRLSPQYLMGCGGGSCGGWEVGPAASYVQKHGVPAEICFPYGSGSTGKDISCQKACPNPSETIVHAASVSTPTTYSFDLDALKLALQKGPLATTLDVYADLMLYGGGVYKHVTGDNVGGHAVSIVGYDDNLQALIIRNSWGVEWGENGFAHISYDDVSGVGDETWAFSMPSIAGGVSVEAPLDYSYFTGKASVKVNSTYADTDSLNITFYNSSGKAVWNDICPGKQCELNPDVSNLTDSKYTVQAIAWNALGKSLGQSFPQTFYVVNAKPKLTLSFDSADGTDLSQPLSGTVVLQVALTTSNGLPMNSVEFHYKNAEGKDVKRLATNVADGMQLDWGTDLRANGKYEVWMVGHVTTNSFDATIETPHINVELKN